MAAGSDESGGQEGPAFFLSLQGDKGGLAFLVDEGRVSVLHVRPGVPETEHLPVLGECDVVHLAYVARLMVVALKDVAPPGLLDREFLALFRSRDLEEDVEPEEPASSPRL